MTEPLPCMRMRERPASNLVNERDPCKAGRDRKYTELPAQVRRSPVEYPARSPTVGFILLPSPQRIGGVGFVAEVDMRDLDAGISSRRRLGTRC